MFDEATIEAAKFAKAEAIAEIVISASSKCLYYAHLISPKKRLFKKWSRKQVRINRIAKRNALMNLNITAYWAAFDLAKIIAQPIPKLLTSPIRMGAIEQYSGTQLKITIHEKDTFNPGRSYLNALRGADSNTETGRPEAGS